MRILGIDPGMCFTGYAVFELDNRVTRLLSYGLLRFNAKKPLPERILEFHEKIALLAKNYTITHIAIETPFLGKNAQNFLKLGYLRGIIYLLSQKNNIKILEFSPREVKCSVTGSGGADKQQVAFMVHRLMPAIEVNLKSDVTDALAIGLCGVWQAQKSFSTFLRTFVVYISMITWVFY
jgi:crossover junction endodeoxyribonuclease RuvC